MMLVEDELGESVWLREAPTSVVSLVPSMTESIAATVPGVLVGATKYCVHPATLDVARVGGSKFPEVDDIIDLEPELVVANVEENRREDVDRLRANGIQVWVSKAPHTVADAIGTLHRLFDSVFHVPEPDWLTQARDAWREAVPVYTTAIIPVWRRPWMLLGRDNFATDVLLRLGVRNAFADTEDRYPRSTMGDLRNDFAAGRADLLVLPDEPYKFTAQDGPLEFPRQPFVLVSGRYLTWWGPSMAIARTELANSLANVIVPD
jgi:ABC-type Fe3+-hydroxamate transport system substrate-binding protein